MRFTVFSISTLPDVATARRLYPLDGLDDASACKVLFHQRKQQAGARQPLRWDQRRVAALALLEHDDNQVRIALPGEGGDEADLLQAFFDAAAAAPHLVSWNGRGGALPLLHLRALKLNVPHAAYWQARTAAPARHLDLLDWLAVPGGETPRLDGLARTLDLPGMLGLDDDEVLAAWLAGRQEDARAHAALCALNTYLIALRMYGIVGEVTPHQAQQSVDSLRAALAGRQEPQIAAFAKAWEG
jgi:predicted PolB exonuclease-like 3'-5' exonuclease